MKMPEPTRAIEILAEAQAIRETWSPNDASQMISDGFILVGVCATPKGEHPFHYSLIWPRPVAEAEPRVKELWGLR